jgi:hypothetical protein
MDSNRVKVKLRLKNGCGADSERVPRAEKRLTKRCSRQAARGGDSNLQQFARAACG